MEKSVNIFGEPLITCSNQPVTGYFRDGCCNTDERDQGMHTVCAELTQEFLDFSKEQGNDLVTPRPEWDFPGLKPGDRWCLCASRWLEAQNAGVAPPVDLEATHEKTLEVISMETLVAHALIKTGDGDS